MITLLIMSLLLAITISMFMFLYLTSKGKGKTISSRLDDISNLSVESEPAHQQELPEAKKDLSIEDSYSSKFGRMLFLAGLRTKAHLRFFKILQIAAFTIPVVSILLNFMAGELSTKSILKAITVGALIYGGAFIILRAKVESRKAKIFRSMPVFFDLLVITLEAGVNFTGALPRILRELPPNDPLTQEFNYMHNEYLAGLPFNEACLRLADRCDVEDLTIILDSLVEAEKLGASLAGTLRIQAEQLRHKIRMRLKERAHKIPVKLMMPMMMIFSTLFVIVFGPLGAKLFGTISEAFPQGPAATDTVSPANPGDS